VLGIVHKLVAGEWGYPDTMRGRASREEKKSTYRAIVLASMLIPVAPVPGFLLSADPGESEVGA
jgi:hypothetical protein